MVPVAAALLCAAATVGCRGKGKGAAGPPRGATFTTITPHAFAAARLEATAAADTYTTVVAQAADELRAATTRPEVADWAQQQRIATAVASFTNATGPNGFVGLLDMLVLTTLKRQAVEEHWIPTLLHDEGKPFLEALRRGEQDVWRFGGRVLSEAQLADLRRIIEQWRADNPTQYYVSHVRFTDFANAMRVTSSSPQVKLPGSVFGLLYVDPLAGLDPVAKELALYRELTERLVFIINRMPIILGWEVDFAVYRATNGPQVVRFVDNTAKFADSTTRFADATVRVAQATTQAAAAINRTADAVVKVPESLPVERAAALSQVDGILAERVKGALDQTFAGITEQRQATTREIGEQESRLRQVVADVRGVVERADEAGLSVNTATVETIRATEQATRRTLTYATILALVVIASIPLALLLYRAAVKRWALNAAP